MIAHRPLAGWQVLAPRGGDLGTRLAEALAALGAEPTIATVVDFAPPGDPLPLERALARLAAGGFDWLVLTSATAVDTVPARLVPPDVRVAAVGHGTAAAASEHGLRVDFVPSAASGEELVAQWPARSGRVLLPLSSLANSVVESGLAAHGMAVTAVTAYEPVPVPLDAETRDGLRDGAFDAVLVTAGSVARRLLEESGSIAPRTRIVAIGPRTAAETRELGLRVDAIAVERSAAGLVAVLMTLVDQEESA